MNWPWVKARERQEHKAEVLHQVELLKTRALLYGILGDKAHVDADLAEAERLLRSLR